VVRTTESDATAPSESEATVHRTLHGPSFGGVGGSVVQTLDSDGVKSGNKALREKRRAKKKSEYAEYLKTETWQKIRARALRRDRYRCRACKGVATEVHHVRYPQVLGQEKLEWLYSLCVPCHGEIHKRTARGMKLRKATNQVLNMPKAERKQRREKPAKLKLPQKRSRFDRSTPRPSVAEENERLHALQVRNRERRSRQRG